MAMWKLKDADVKPGMIVRQRPNLSERYEVLEVRGAEKVLLRREDLETRTK